MSRQTQGTLSIVAAIAGGIFLVAFVALLVIGQHDFNTAAFLAILVSGGAALFLYVAFHRRPVGPDGQTGIASRPASQPAVAKPAAKPEPQAAPAAVADAEPGPATKPAGLTAPDGEPDDLKKIKGVGPKLEQLLHGMGYYHYSQVAGWTAEEVAWVDDNLEGFKGRVSRDNWVDQAKLLATGGETEFSKRVEEGDVY